MLPGFLGAEQHEEAREEGAVDVLAPTSREQTFDPRLKWALVPAFFAPGTRETFSPGGVSNRD